MQTKATPGPGSDTKMVEGPKMSGRGTRIGGWMCWRSPSEDASMSSQGEASPRQFSKSCRPIAERTEGSALRAWLRARFEILGF